MVNVGDRSMSWSPRVTSTYRGVPGGEEDGECGRQVDVLVSQGHQHPAAGPPQLSVQHRVQNRVIVLHVLREDGHRDGVLLIGRGKPC